MDAAHCQSWGLSSCRFSAFDGPKTADVIKQNVADDSDTSPELTNSASDCLSASTWSWLKQTNHTNSCPLAKSF